MEASNLSYIEFKVVVIRMLSSMKRNIKIIKKEQPKIKNTISEMKKTPEGINKRSDEAQNQISTLEDKVEKTPIRAAKRKQSFKN